MSCESTWIEIDRGALRHNLTTFRNRVGSDVRLGAVVKSNAYGHGLAEAVAASASVADWLCVDGVDEALAIRTLGDERPVLIMGHVPAERWRDVARTQGIRPTVYNVSDLERLSAEASSAGRTVPVHVKVETGTYRQGLEGPALDAFIQRAGDLEGIELEGASMHFADIEDTTDHRFARRQIEAFDEACERIRSSGPVAEPFIRHAACSAAAVLFASTHLELVRVGISQYGLWSSKETYVACLEQGKPTMPLKPALTWKTRIAQVKDVPEGADVGYGRTWRATRSSRIAVLPVGYHEGLDRRLSNTGHVLIHGKRAAIRGRVCMNMCMVDVTDVPGAEVGSDVVLIGGEGDERVSVEHHARWCGSIAYEIVARLHPAIKRVGFDRDDADR